MMSSHWACPRSGLSSNFQGLGAYGLKSKAAGLAAWVVALLCIDLMARHTCVLSFKNALPLQAIALKNSQRTGIGSSGIYGTLS